jgi:hypothetical protein
MNLLKHLRSGSKQRPRLCARRAGDPLTLPALTYVAAHTNRPATKVGL